jgi:hypothetical protein
VDKGTFHFENLKKITGTGIYLLAAVKNVSDNNLLYSLISEYYTLYQPDLLN